MSKSAGNVVKPLDLADVYGVDVLRFYLMSGLAPGRYADFDEDILRTRYQSALANDPGNLLHRLVDMIGRYCDGCVPTPGEPSTGESAPRLRCDGLGHEVFGHVAEFAVNRALVSLGEAVGDINRYVEHAAEGLRLTSVLLWPVMAELWHCLGWQPPGLLSEALSWAGLALGTPVVSGPPLFPRL